MKLFISESKAGALASFENLLKDQRENLERLSSIKRSLIQQKEQAHSQAETLKFSSARVDSAIKKAAATVHQFEKVVVQLKKRQKELSSQKFKKDFEPDDKGYIKII